MISAYCNQAATLERRNGYADTGEAQYDEAVEINVRHEGSTKLVRNAEGEAVTSTAKLMTPVEIAEGDRITINSNTFYIMKAKPATGLDGKPLFWEAELQ